MPRFAPDEPLEVLEKQSVTAIVAGILLLPTDTHFLHVRRLPRGQDMLVEIRCLLGRRSRRAEDQAARLTNHDLKHFTSSDERSHHQGITLGERLSPL